MNISVITATYNCADTIESCINSVVRQTYADVEHLVVDGASSDGTLAILKAHENEFTLTSEPDEGIYSALNKGLEQASGEVIGFLHGDDFFPADSVLQQVADEFSDPDVDAVYGDLNYVSRSDPTKVVRNWKSSDFTSGLLKRGWMPPHPTLYVRRKWYQKLGCFDAEYKIAADYAWILRLFSHAEFQSRYIPQTLVSMRLGGVSNRSLGNIFRKSKEDLKALRSSGIGGYNVLLKKNFSKIGQFF